MLSHSIRFLEIDFDKTTLLLKTVDLRAVRELGTSEGDEFVELSDILKRIGRDVLIDQRNRRHFWDVLLPTSQRSAINFLRAIAEKIVMGQVDWQDADLRGKLRKEKIDVF